MADFYSVRINKMKILEFDFNKDLGFAWIIVSGKNGSGLEVLFTIQCCLKEKDGKIELKINTNDCGDDWGCCGEANEKAFEYFGKDLCMTALFNEAKLNGIEAV